MDRRVAAAAAVAVSVAAYALVVSLPAVDVPAVDVPAVDVPAVDVPADAEQDDPGQNARTTVVPAKEFKFRPDGIRESIKTTAEVSVYTDRREYRPGETISYSLTNHGPGVVTFIGKSLGVQVRDLFENTVFGREGERWVIEIPANSTFSDTWDQRVAGRGVQSGTYVLDFDGIKSWPFTIMHDNPAFYEPEAVEGRSLEILIEKDRYRPGDVIRSALVNTGTEAVESGPHIKASVVDASGAVVDGVWYDQWDGIIEPGERIQMQPLGNPLVVLDPGEYRIAAPDGPESGPFVVEGPDLGEYADAGWIDAGQNVRTTHVPIWEYERRSDGMSWRVQTGTSEMSIYTDKREYEPGEEVRYGITNHGPGAVMFRDTGLGFEIRDTFGNPVAGRGGGDAETSIPVGSTSEGTWPQGGGGSTAQSGTYVVSFTGLESWPFTITHENPAFYEPETVEGRSLEILVEKRWYRHGEEIRSALVNTGTVAAGSERWIEAGVVDASGAVVDEIIYYSRDEIIEPGERLQRSIPVHPEEPLPPGEYHIATSDGTMSAPFVIE
ncbi:MAG: hypothetical protein MPI95_07405 [Nitrosopumilus sp.]|nr:hypothetical protein [Nitrosopumilus sp.]MDA7958890.1 hypothetical protein [Nitrosopumilus sp.]